MYLHHRRHIQRTWLWFIQHLVAPSLSRPSLTMSSSLHQVNRLHQSTLHAVVKVRGDYGTQPTCSSMGLTCCDLSPFWPITVMSSDSKTMTGEQCVVDKNCDFWRPKIHQKPNFFWAVPWTLLGSLQHPPFPPLPSFCPTLPLSLPRNPARGLGELLLSLLIGLVFCSYCRLVWVSQKTMFGICRADEMLFQPTASNHDDKQNAMHNATVLNKQHSD